MSLQAKPHAFMRFDSKRIDGARGVRTFWIGTK
jgi:hypothetical protein